MNAGQPPEEVRENPSPPVMTQPFTLNDEIMDQHPACVDAPMTFTGGELRANL